MSCSFFSSPRRAVPEVKSPLVQSAPAVQAGVPTSASTPIRTDPVVGTVIGRITNGGSSAKAQTSGPASTPHGPSRKSRTKEEALSILHELKQELLKQNQQLEKQNEQREAFCQKLLEQNNVMIRQRERRNELLEELVRLQRN